jgi:hypothetical protein
MKRRITIYYVFLRSLLRLLVTANVPTSPILVTQIMEAICSSEKSVLTRGTLRNTPQDGILLTVNIVYKAPRLALGAAAKAYARAGRMRPAGRGLNTCEPRVEWVPRRGEL